jgi:hypothetical protein
MAVLLLVLVPVAAGAVWFVRGTLEASRSPVAGSATATGGATRAPVGPMCPAAFESVPANVEPAPRPVFVAPGAMGATLCRYFDFNRARVRPLIEARDLPGDPAALVQVLNSLPAFPTETEWVDPEGMHHILAVGACTMDLVHTYVVVLHYPDSLNIQVMIDPPCQSVTSDGDGRLLRGVADLLRHWGIDV